MNIVEAYIKKKGQLIILISGFSGSGKTTLAREIERDFKIKFVNLNDFFKESYNEVIDLGHDIKVVDWDNPNAINWDKFNETIDKEKASGIVVSGFAFPADKLKFEYDFHINVYIKKDKLIEKRQKYLDENKDNPLNEINDEKTQLFIINNLTFKHFLASKDKNAYVIDSSELTPDHIYDKIFEYIKVGIEKYLYRN
jgi:adenylate kinase family enzyme